MKRVIIIGGGITGLAAAHRVLERSCEAGKRIHLTVLEAGSRVGGIVHTQERDGFLLESGPDSFISEKPAAVELAGRLGLESHLIETNERYRRSFIVRQGRLRPVPEGFHLLAPSQFWPFVKSDIFSWRGKARMALDLILPRRHLNGSAVNDTVDESLAQFVRRRLGREALERMAQPMVGGIYTADPEKLSLRATMPRFLEMEREHRSLILALRKTDSSPTPGFPRGQPAWGGTVREGSPDTGLRGSSPTIREGVVSGTSGARYSLFLSFDRGMQLLTDKLEERISDLKFQITGGGPPSESSIRVNTAVESLTLERAEGDATPKWKVRTNRGDSLVADTLCLALPAHVSARLLRSVDEPLASELEGIPYASSATLNLAYKRADIPHPLDGFGFVVPFIEKRSIIACTFSSVKFPGRAPQDHALLRAFVGGALQPEILELSDDELLSAVGADLRNLLGIERAPLFAEVTKWKRSMPQYHVGHLERVKRIEQRLASLPALALAGNAYSGLGIPDCIRSGEGAADAVLATLAESRSNLRSLFHS